MKVRRDNFTSLTDRRTDILYYRNMEQVLVKESYCHVASFCVLIEGDKYFFLEVYPCQALLTFTYPNQI